MEACSLYIDTKIDAFLQKEMPLTAFKTDIHILIAEDSEINRLLIGEVLSAFGVKTTFVNNGEEAIFAYKSRALFDMVLMDVNMPIVGGIEASRAIVAFEREQKIAHTPIAALTANAGYKQKCVKAGMDDFIGKPFKISDFDRLFDKFLKHKILDGNEVFSYDISKVASVLGVSQESIAKHINSFTNSARIELDNMKAYAIKQEYAKLAGIAHKFKGTASLLGFEALADNLSRIEFGAKNNEDCDYETILCDIKAQVNEICLG